MLDQALLQAALTLTLNLHDDPCHEISPIKITYNQEVYETFPGNQGGQVLQVVEGTTGQERFVVIIRVSDSSVLSFLQTRTLDDKHDWISNSWNRGQLSGTLSALQSDNHYQLVRPAYCDLPSFNMNQYDL
jgi:hypothetical protein